MLLFEDIEIFNFFIEEVTIDELMFETALDLVI
jgi:hypothetical protein